MLQLETMRRRRGWSQARLAREAALNQSTVCQIESGRFVPYETQLAKLAKALDIDPSRATELMEATKNDD